MSNSTRSFQTAFLCVALSSGLLLLATRQSGAQNCPGLPLRKVLSSKTPADSLLLPQDKNGCTMFTISTGRISRGSVIDFNATVNPTVNCDDLYVLEYLDGRKWTTCDTAKFYRSDDPATRQPTTIMQTFRLQKTAGHELKLRLRPVDSTREGVDGTNERKAVPQLSLAKYGYTAEYVQNFGKGTAKDTTDILCIGNSFTYVGATPFLLKEIAWNEGHLLRIRASLKGGQTFGQHLKLPLTDFAIHADLYDYAFLQNQSQAAARYASGLPSGEQTLKDMVQLMSEVVDHSPECRIVLESTWAFSAADFGGFGSYGNFDLLTESGTSMLIEEAEKSFRETVFKQAAEPRFSISPIGRAFAEVRRTQSEGQSDSTGIALYDKDNKHQSIYGAYLKACVNYLILFGESFKAETDCGLDRETAATLRAAAEKIVLGH